jgi:hypothetical protein
MSSSSTHDVYKTSNYGTQKSNEPKKIHKKGRREITQDSQPFIQDLENKSLSLIYKSSSPHYKLIL